MKEIRMKKSVTHYIVYSRRAENISSYKLDLRKIIEKFPILLSQMPPKPRTKIYLHKEAPKCIPLFYRERTKGETDEKASFISFSSIHSSR